MKANGKADRAEIALRRAKLYIRHAIDVMNKDFSHTKYLNPLAGRIAVRIIKWDKKTYNALIMIYDTEMEKRGIHMDKIMDPYSMRNNFPSDILIPDYKWISLSGYFYKSDLWECLNKAAISLRKILNV